MEFSLFQNFFVAVIEFNVEFGPTMKTGPKPKSLAERLWARVSKGDPDACWEWNGYRMPSGYGKTRHR